jgi:hypothetical protein
VVELAPDEDRESIAGAGCVAGVSLDDAQAAERSTKKPAARATVTRV